MKFFQVIVMLAVFATAGRSTVATGVKHAEEGVGKHPIRAPVLMSYHQGADAAKFMQMSKILEKKRLLQSKKMSRKTHSLRH
ncbi:hypothetical protein GNI_050060 [Gregarina niphandrodes]|uniref:Transmembrane protein n=1 Tax=Gregarina niphandrodes TaxID=110365 RepID=A0A023B9G0_GRENI|nr:hypothetical protein GNI_050060 [Gregarina niphandrodes]EZG72956.1 hypothetical protein GNI_050060 [Gregarina niphandrodes]|eukprot:XP_011129715.1 hypothetical protein GNI_050060 [Gregarina niphandrodes]